jgi:CHAT domain-containing protein
MVRISVDLAEISQLITQYRRAIELEDDEAQPLARKLYDLAFAPVDRILREKGITEIALSLDDVLRYLPFAALHDGQNWLVERYSFSQFRDAGDLVVRARSGPWRVAGFGLTRKFEGFAALPNVSKELRGIVADGTGGMLQGTLRLDEKFDRASLKTASGKNVAAVHLASHFYLDPSRLDKSYLLLGNGEHLGLDAFGKHGGLDLSNADFLALSACETALPSPSANGAEIDSLAEVAQDAGAPAVLASLWSVSDDSTAQLMIEFYNAKTNRDMSKDGALQAAQLKLIADARSGRRPAKWAQPFYWAPFILLGDPR